MTTATTRKQQLDGKYINPMIDQYSSKKEDPLVLMAQACDNIGKELLQEKSKSSSEGKKSLKRPASTITPPPPPKKHLSSSVKFDYIPQFHSSLFSPLFHQSSYLIGSMFSTPFTCNWMDSNHPDGVCGKRFLNHFHLLEHFYTEHTPMKFPYSYTSIN